jgi:formylmethanofuran dehydrogenase subunit B
MARGRKSNETEANRELKEGKLCKLGNARVLMHLVRDRIEAARIAGNTEFLDVAIQDLNKAERFVREAQQEIEKEKVEG